jgi:hypothetical protein
MLECGRGTTDKIVGAADLLPFACCKDESTTGAPIERMPQSL